MIEASDLGCRMHIRLQVFKALGSWRDGAEHSMLLLTNSDVTSIRYLLSKLGSENRQKGVLYFHRERGGPARLYVLYARRRMQRLNSLALILDAIGIDSSTLVPLKHRTAIYVVDEKREMLSKLLALKKRLAAKLQVQEGTAEFIGDEVDRQKAADVFQNEITNYESKHGAPAPTCRARARR